MNETLNLTGFYNPAPQAQISYYDILEYLGADIVSKFALCGVCVLLYAIINISVDRDKVLFSTGPVEMKIKDFDYFMLAAGVYFSLMGAVFYFNIPLA